MSFRSMRRATIAVISRIRPQGARLAENRNQSSRKLKATASFYGSFVRAWGGRSGSLASTCTASLPNWILSSLEPSRINLQVGSEVGSHSEGCFLWNLFTNRIPILLKPTNSYPFDLFITFAIFATIPSIGLIRCMYNGVCWLVSDDVQRVRFHSAAGSSSSLCKAPSPVNGAVTPLFTLATSVCG